MLRSPVLAFAPWTAGCTVAGGIIGCAEGLYRAVPLLYATLLYATVWTLVGMILGSLAATVPRLRTWTAPTALASGAALAGGLTGGVLLRFILWRDLFVEAPDKVWLATLGGVAAGVVIAAALASLAWWVGRHMSDVILLALPTTACCLFAGLAWPRPEHPPQATAAPRRSQAHGVILVVADALRADALGAYGAPPHRETAPSPEFDALSNRGALFTHASAQASWTKPAMASLLTARYARDHGTMAKNAMLPQGLPTLASELQRHGVYTSAVVTNYNLEPGFGFQRGFDNFEYLPAARYLNAPPEATRLAGYNAYRLLRERLFKAARESRYFYRSGHWVNTTALRLLDQHPQGPFFLWLHYMEPHDPYFDNDGTSWARVSDPHPSAAAVPAMQRAYRDGVRRWDAALGELLAGLHARGLTDETLLVVTADHGEEFGEHQGFYHGTSLYEELLHVPLVLTGPGITPGVHENLVQQIDIAPTILQHFGIDPPSAWEGVSLYSAASRGLAWAEEDHEGNVLSAVQISDDAATLKLILANPDNPRGLPPQALYDLWHDPGERKVLADDDPRLQILRQRLTTLQDPNRQHPQAPARPLDNASQAELRSLGYIQ